VQGNTHSPQRLEFLDVARGVAALMVVLAHGLAQCVPGFLDWSLSNLDLGRAGVVLFLLISGFIIPVSLEQGGSLGKFWLRRFFRLYPAYWVSVAAAFLYVALGPLPLQIDLNDVDSWLANLTMCQSFFGRPHAWGLFWTLQLELVVYAVCSLLFACGQLRRVGWVLGIVLVLGFLAIGVGRPLVLGKAYFINNNVRILYFAPLVGLVARRYWAGQLSARRFYLFLAFQPATLVAVWTVSALLCPEGVQTLGLRTILFDWGLAYLCFAGLLEARRWRMPAAGLWLGRVSYSVYLFHPLFIVLLAPAGLPAWLYLPLLVGATLATAALAYHAVEAPGVALGRAIEKRLFPLPASPASSVAPISESRPAA
jgi:peptidoglycan/LPS O-acetylase OafA/YrhL